MMLFLAVSSRTYDATGTGAIAGLHDDSWYKLRFRSAEKECRGGAFVPFE